MKFKAILSYTGLKSLERSFLPTLDKFGKKCSLLLSPEALYLVQDVNDADGMQVAARLCSEVVFEPDAAGAPGPHVCQSRCANFIGFEVEIALLLRVLRSAAAHEAQLLEMRLTVRAVPGVAADAASQRPMLLFSWHGDSVALGQEMPIGKPYVEVVLKQVRALCEAPTLCPFYLDILPDVAQLMVVTDKLRSLLGSSGQLTLALTRQGDLHLGVEGPGVRLGEGLNGLAVFPQAVADAARQLTSTTCEGRLREAHRCGEVASVLLQLKHLQKALHSAPLTSPGRMLCGVAEGGGYVHVMFAYDGRGGEAYNDSFSLTYKLPVREEDCDL